MRPRRSLYAAVALLQFVSAARSQTAGRVVEDVDVTVRAGYVDLTLVYACGLRYLNHMPSSEGEQVRIRTTPQPDCALGGDGLFAPPVPAVARGIVQSIDLDRPVGAEVHITIRWRKSERFLVVPTGDGRGLRIRVLRPSEGRVILGDDTAARSAAYAVNLESSREPFSDEAIAAAARTTGLRTYVSQTQIDNEAWYRLRAGPFAYEADAKRSLLALRDSYPKAWVAIADDEVLTAAAALKPATSALERNASNAATLTGAEVAGLLKQAKSAFRKKDYETAVPLLTKLLEQPEFPDRAEAQELIGLSRERSKQIAHAKAEYEEYLRRYPNGPAAERVRLRLQALALAARKAVKGLRSDDESDSAWKMYGGFSQLYRRDESQLQNSVVTANATTQNALLNDFAFIARRRGERFDFTSRVSAGFVKNFLDNGLADRTRVSAAFVELGDRQWGWHSRLGRQSVAGSGVFGTFDGLFLDYQWRPKWRFSVSAGSPVDSTRSSYDNERQFVAMATNFGPFFGAWDITGYAVLQQYAGETDRRAVGGEVHYFQPGRTAIALADYDLYYGELNNVLVLSTIDLPARWTLNVTADRRTSPTLGVRNALIGQSTGSLEELLNTFTREEIDQFARDRTGISELYGMSLSRPLGERWQWTFDVSSIAVGGTVESGGVEAVPDAPREMAYSSLAIGNGVFTNGDLQVIAVRFQSGGAAQTSSVGFSSRWPLWSTWRLTPRIRADRRVFVADDSVQWIYAPSLRLDYMLKRAWFELEAGTEFGKRDVGSSFEKSRRDYFGLGYRYNF